MSFAPVRTVTSHTVVLPAANIDTDQIIPARFLTTTDKQGLGDLVFYDWRYADGATNDHVLNSVRAKSAQVLVAGNNFGCGSSREHAPWALVDYGFRVVISTEIADIFRSNALKNGLVAAVVADDFHERLLVTPDAQVTVDVASQTITCNDIQTSFELDAFSRTCLLNGTDEMDYLLSHGAAINAFEANR